MLPRMPPTHGVMKNVRSDCSRITSACGEVDGHEIARPNGVDRPMPTATIGCTRDVMNTPGTPCVGVFESVFAPDVSVNDAFGWISEPLSWKLVPSPTARPPML